MLLLFLIALLFLYSGGGWQLLPCFLFPVCVMIDIAILDGQWMPVRLLVGFQIPFLFPLIICSLLFVYWATGYFVVEQIGAEDA